ncbi:uncharacterized protein KY384_002246 [Bacidia gigantensis]|uniref:uncharacterized protein n=1 Tax=Bacidia gigantensis TaxID=2732470 RepID=UPI001D03A801|nr:uncharacterized protein KY384_002246 [Bacidia gigantensis]KAG8533463.1 hypothetical protein KY384_002246 [Bacidia gigantensis]
MADHTASTHTTLPYKDSQSQSKTTGQHPLSCTHCRHRKVKCNKTYPCLPCQRSGLECTFPERAKHPKKKKYGQKSTTEELLARLSRMETLLGSIDGDGKTEHQEPEQNKASPNARAETPIRKGSWNLDKKDASGNPDHLNRYIGGHFWRSISNEVEGLRQAMDDASDGEDVTPQSDPSQTDGHTPQSTTFGSAYNTPQILRHLHPNTAHINQLFDLFATNVDAVFKVLHIPTARNFIANVVANLDEIPTDNYVEPLLFAVYYSAVTTLTNEQCLLHFQDGRASLLSRYRAGIERALTNAGYLNTTELGTIQALTIFLVSVRTNDDSQFTWTLVATAIRLAHGIGLHRESNNVGLPPLQVELRRRVWWQLIVLDIRCCEDRASEPIITPISFNTKRPLNINDADIDPEMLSPPAPRPGFTEMSKVAVSHEVSFLRWRWGDITTFNAHGEENLSKVPYEERLEVLNALKKTLNENILQYCDLNNPIAWVTSVVARLIICRIRLVVYHPIEFSTGRVTRPAVSRERLLETAVAGMEFAHLLDTEPKAAQWRWFFKTYVQWHALATTLAELCVQTKGPLVERAWRIVDIVFDDWAARIADSPNGMLWRPMKKLMTKAQTKRRESSFLSEGTVNDLGHQQPLPQFDQLSFQMPGSGQGLGSGLGDVPIVQPGLPSMNPQTQPPHTMGFGNSGDGGAAMGTTPFNDMLLASPVEGMNLDASLGDAGEGGNEINWAEWDAFMSDFNMSDLPKEPDVLGVGAGAGTMAGSRYLG